MACQVAYSNASGEVILKGILQRLEITISELERETGLSYSLLQRIYNGETKKISLPVYEALKRSYPALNDEYMRNATLPVLTTDNGDEELKDSDVDIIGIVNSARQILKSAERRDAALKEKEMRLDALEQSLSERARRLDDRAQELDKIMHLVVSAQINITSSIADDELAEKLSVNNDSDAENKDNQ